MSESKSSSGGVGFTGLLTIAFIVLKLCKVIDWSWWWVVSPIWISIGIVLIVMGCIGLYYLCKSYMLKSEYEAKKQKRDSELTELQRRANEVHDSIMQGKAESRWQQRMNEMHKQTGGIDWSNKSS